MPQTGVGSVGLDQFPMRAQLGNPSIFDHRDPVGVMGGMQPVGNRDHRAACEYGGKRTLQVARGARVEQRRRFVEDEHPRIDEQQPGEGQLLGLGRGKAHTARADPRVESVGKRGRPSVGVHSTEHAPKRLILTADLITGGVTRVSDDPRTTLPIAGALNAADTTVTFNVPDTAAIAVDSLFAPGAGISQPDRLVVGVH